MINFFAGKGSIAPYDGNGTLLNIFIAPFMGIFGEGEIWSRLPSVIFGSGSVFIAYLLGKELFNKKVGLYVAVLVCFSLYSIFWSRVVRAYTLFSFFYLLSILFFFKAFEPKELKGGINKFWTTYNINPKYLLFFLLSFAASVLANKLALITAFSIGFYIVFRAIFTFFEKDRPTFLSNKYLLLAIPISIFFITFFSPGLSDFFRPILGLFVPDNFIGWFLPNWEEIGALWTNERMKVFDIYRDLIMYDYQSLYLLGVLGFPLAFFINRNGALIQFCFFLIPLLLLSFVLRGVYNPRYIFFIYPLFLLATSVSFYFITHFLIEKFIPSVYYSKLNYLLFFLPILFILPFIRYNEIKDVCTVKNKSGYIVDKKLSTWSFTNWKDATHYLKDRMQDGDVVMATIPTGVNHYMGWRDVGALQFRQVYFNTTTKSYDRYTNPNPTNMDAKTIEGLKRTISEHPRGWLLADYYFDNVVTAPEAKNLIISNLDYHFEATISGDVKVFSWDHSTPKAYAKQDVLIALGKNINSLSSQKMSFNVTESLYAKENISIHLATQGVNSNKEGYFVINEQYRFMLQPNKTQNIDLQSIPLKKEYLTKGNNTIQFGYSGTESRSLRKGFAIHSISFY